MRFGHIKLIFTLFFFVEINAQSTASKQVIKLSIEAPQLNSNKTIWVYLPKDYQKSKKRYPVIYMHDAQNLFDAETSYVGEWKIDEYLDTLTEKESIIVGIEHGNEKRIDELTPYKHEKYGGGNGEAYLTFIIETLKPIVDSRYNTKPGAEHTALFGSSLGGLISFYGVIKYPETFGKAGIFSPAFWINPEVFDLVKSSGLNETSKFYFLVGTAESENMVPDQERMIALLKEKGITEKQIANHIVKDGKHNEQFWSAHFANAYQWLYN